MRISPGRASRYVQSPGNRVRSNDTDRKGGRRADRTFEMRRAVRAAAEARAHPSAPPLCKRWRAVYLDGAIRSRAFHEAFLSRGLGQSGNEASLRQIRILIEETCKRAS